MQEVDTSVGIPAGCSVQHSGNDVTTHSSVDPHWNAATDSDNNRMGASPCGNAPCDEFRALCSYGIPMGAPEGLDQYSTVAGSNTLFAFNGDRLGVKVPMNREQKQLQCISKCRKSGSDYKYYMLSDNDACLCSKIDVTATADPSKFGCGAGR